MTSSAAFDTIALLDERMRRVSYVLQGDLTEHDDNDRANSGTALTRLRALERTLAQLLTRSSAAVEALALLKSHPLLFQTGATPPTTLPPTHEATVILAHAGLYTSSSAQLAQLRDTHIPAPGPLAKLVELSSRIQTLRSRQIQQEQELAELRSRSASVLAKWYEMGILDMGDKWADWEDRLREAEIMVRRMEVAKTRENGVV